MCWHLFINRVCPLTRMIGTVRQHRLYSIRNWKSVFSEKSLELAVLADKLQHFQLPITLGIMLCWKIWDSWKYLFKKTGLHRHFWVTWVNSTACILVSYNKAVMNASEYNIKWNCRIYICYIYIWFHNLLSIGSLFNSPSIFSNLCL